MSTWSGRITSGGARRTRALAAGEDEQPAPEARLLDRDRDVVVGEVDADHEPAAPHVGEQRLAGRELLQPGRQLRADASAAFAVSARLDEVERGERGRAATGLPPKVEPWVPARHVIRSARAMMAPSGRPLAMPLPASRMSGSTPSCSTAQNLPGAADPALHLVGDEQDAVLVAELPQPGQEAGRRDDVAALALDRLDEDRRDLLGVDEVAGTACVSTVAGHAVGRVVHAGEQRAEAGPVLRLARGERQATRGCGRGTRRGTR